MVIVLTKMALPLTVKLKQNKTKKTKGGKKEAIESVRRVEDTL